MTMSSLVAVNGACNAEPRGGHACIEARAKFLSNHAERSGLCLAGGASGISHRRAWAAQKRTNPPDLVNGYIHAQEIDVPVQLGLAQQLLKRHPQVFGH